MEETRVTIYFYDFIKEFIIAAETCFNKDLRTPTLVILYTGIDIMGSLIVDEAKAKFDQEQLKKKTGESFGVRHSYTLWVEKYLKPKERLNSKCNSIDIYGARCGLLHELRLESDLSIKNKAQVIQYAWGNAKVENLEKAIVETKEAAIAIHANDFINAFKEGVTDFIDDLKKDKKRLDKVNKKSERFCRQVSTELMQQFLKVEKE